MKGRGRLFCPGPCTPNSEPQVTAHLDPALDGAVGDDMIGGRVNVQLGPGAHAVHRPGHVLQAALAQSLHGDLCPRNEGLAQTCALG